MLSAHLLEGLNLNGGMLGLKEVAHDKVAEVTCTHGVRDSVVLRVRKRAVKAKSDDGLFFSTFAA